MSEVELKEILAERNATHGDFRAQFACAQDFKAVYRACWETYAGTLTPVKRECLDQIAHKLSRILTGDPNHKDHWMDIAGYAQCAANE